MVGLIQRILITGFTGFVSKYLLDHLTDFDERFEILGLSRNIEIESFFIKNLSIKVKKIDLTNQEALMLIIQDFKPDYIYHLASDSSVSYSWAKPIESFHNNTNIFLNLVESVRAIELKCRILSVGSSEEYGIVNSENLPLIESAPLNPVSPYAVARVAQELISKVYVNGYGLDIVLTRSFNHIGPNQKEVFVVSSFAKQIIEYKLGRIKSVEVGNVEIIRDFLDVRDVVKAYVSLMKSGKSGEIYNVCSGVGYSLKEVIVKMMHIAGVEPLYYINQELIRLADNPIIIGDNNKIINQCNWQPAIELDDTLASILSFWNANLTKS